MGELVQWAKRSYVRARTNGWEGVATSVYQLYKGLWRLGTRIPLGENVYSYEWDLLVVLDGCRVDLIGGG